MSIFASQDRDRASKIGRRERKCDSIPMKRGERRNNGTNKVVFIPNTILGSYNAKYAFCESVYFYKLVLLLFGSTFSFELFYFY